MLGLAPAFYSLSTNTKPRAVTPQAPAGPGKLCVSEGGALLARGEAGGGWLRGEIHVWTGVRASRAPEAAGWTELRLGRVHAEKWQHTQVEKQVGVELPSTRTDLFGERSVQVPRPFFWLDCLVLGC